MRFRPFRLACYNACVSKQPKKPKKTRRDVAEIARDIVEKVTGEKLSGGPTDPSDVQESPKPGPSEGGKARAEKLSPERRKEIAKKAVEARWRNNED